MASGVVIERHEGTPQGGPRGRLCRPKSSTRSIRSWTRSCAWPMIATCMRLITEGMDAVLAFRGRVRTHAPAQEPHEEKSTVTRGLTRQFLGMAFWRGSGRGGSQPWWHHAAHTVHVVLSERALRTAWRSLGSPRNLNCAQPPDADPHVRWCGRGRTTPIRAPSSVACRAAGGGHSRTTPVTRTQGIPRGRPHAPTSETAPLLQPQWMVLG